jgi:hypothetical protein
VAAFSRKLKDEACPFYQLKVNIGSVLPLTQSQVGVRKDSSYENESIALGNYENLLFLPLHTWKYYSRYTQQVISKN